jgi:hypothetical protein
MGGACSVWGGRRVVHMGFLVGKPERNIPLGRHRCIWKDNIKMDHNDIG